MVLGVISDIHGNIEALDAVLRDLEKRKVDRIYCLGDIVGYNPNPIQCIERIKEIGAKSIKGNHERAVLGEVPLYEFNPVAREAILWTKSALDKSSIKFLEGLPERIIEEYCFVHGSLRDPDIYIFTSTDAVREFYALEEVGRSVSFFGHTHIQGAFTIKDGSLSYTRASFSVRDCQMAIVNPGAVGQPRDGDPRAAALVFDTESGRVDFIRVSYPVEKVLKKIAEVGLPRWLGERLKKGV